MHTICWFVVVLAYRPTTRIWGSELVLRWIYNVYNSCILYNKHELGGIFLGKHFKSEILYLKTHLLQFVYEMLIKAKNLTQIE